MVVAPPNPMAKLLVTCEDIGRRYVYIHTYIHLRMHFTMKIICFLSVNGKEECLCTCNQEEKDLLLAVE